MLKYFVFLFFLILLVRSSPITQGLWIYHQDSSDCSAPVVAGLSMENGVLNTFDAKNPSNTFIVNATQNQDGTYSGLGTVYNSNTNRIVSYIKISVALSNSYAFVATYYTSWNPPYPGSEFYYSLLSCNSTSLLI
ncbi:hypothetical protein PPL_09950 [Heterostelium album PN500]|uniref:Uncharacterized protein n=1 Tax=Heterostelium pallidum (strain ATCC 26659 / Pp 5 / PN500) TaxID=670386 RepID=D3BPM5_HETP5|nr:hypothetical protein PPL_09950 [Heterostelium album PN500]EFA76645.1 hypothetical protein PPL_09950 [Heterostelium album PN500]|eukprot:XP_020428777.1 hypothetical protein PPL_09950 [Heterostelium album PN500]